MNEHGYIRSIHRHIPSDTYRWKINDNYAGGVPDAYYCNKGGYLFVEYKYVPKLPKRDSTIVKPALSSGQTLWLKERHEQNVPVAVILGTPIGSVMFVAMQWEKGTNVGFIHANRLQNKGIANIIHSHCLGDLDVRDYEPTDSDC